MRMSEVMTKGVQTVKPAMAAADAWELMRRKEIHHLVVMEGARIVGVLSDRDVGGRAALRHPAQLLARAGVALDRRRRALG